MSPTQNSKAKFSATAPESERHSKSSAKASQSRTFSVAKQVDKKFRSKTSRSKRMTPKSPAHLKPHSKTNIKGKPSSSKVRLPFNRPDSAESDSLISTDSFDRPEDMAPERASLAEKTASPKPFSKGAPTSAKPFSKGKPSSVRSKPSSAKGKPFSKKSKKTAGRRPSSAASRKASSKCVVPTLPSPPVKRRKSTASIKTLKSLGFESIRGERTKSDETLKSFDSVVDVEKSNKEHRSSIFGEAKRSHGFTAVQFNPYFIPSLTNAFENTSMKSLKYDRVEVIRLRSCPFEETPGPVQDDVGQLTIIDRATGMLAINTVCLVSGHLCVRTSFAALDCFGLRPISGVARDEQNIEDMSASCVWSLEIRLSIFSLRQATEVKARKFPFSIVADHRVVYSLDALDGKVESKH